MATTIQNAAIGVVSATKGEVFARGADGQVRRLAIGDNVFEGDVIVTANGSSAEITPFNGPVLEVQEQQTISVDSQVAAPAHDTTAGTVEPLGSTEAAKVIQAVGGQTGPDFNATLDDEATAAGLTGGDAAQGGHSFVDLVRIVETVPTVGYEFPTNPGGTAPTLAGEVVVPTTSPPEAVVPPVANPDANQVREDGFVGETQSVTAVGNIISNDTDAINLPLTVAAVIGSTADGKGGFDIVGAYGTLHVNQDGSYLYTLDNAAANVQSLAEGQSVTDVFTYVATDGANASNPATLTITISGTNDAPVITGDAAAGTAIEAGNLDDGTVVAGTPSVGGTLTSSDVDADHTATWSIAGTSAYGSISIDAATGAWTYKLDNSSAATQALKEGDVKTESFTATVTDDHGATATQTVTITIAGTNDSPVISYTGSNDAGTVKEDVTTSVSGQLASADVDADHTAAWSINGPSSSQYGTISVDGSGKWTYTLNNSSPAVQALAAGDVITETYTVRVVDDKGAWDDQAVTVTINGTNDAPVVDAVKDVFMPDAADQLTGAYANGYALSLAAPTDVDSNALTITVTGLPAHGSIGYVDDTGFHPIVAPTVLSLAQFESLTYQPDGLANYAANGQPISGADHGTFTYAVSDGIDSTIGTVNLNTLLGTAAHTDTVRIGDGNEPLTSGHDQTVSYIVSPALAAEDDYSQAVLQLKTDFNVRSSKDLSSAVEDQVTVTLTVDGHDFTVVQAANGVSDWTGHGTNANSGGYWQDDVPFTHIVATIDSVPTNLADYLASHPATAGSSWTVTYDDNTEGNQQARYLSASFINSVDGTSNVSTGGTDHADLIYGSTSGGDVLGGGAGSDVIVGREGADTISGGSGDDTLAGGSGVDTFVWRLADAAGTSALAPATDHVTDFRAGDTLQLNDLVSPTAQVSVTTGDNNTTVTVAADASHVQVIVLEGYLAVSPADMAHQLQTTTHFTG